MKFEINFDSFGKNCVWVGLSVNYVFYVSRGTFWGKKYLNQFVIFYFLPSKNLFRFSAKFIRQGCQICKLRVMRLFSQDTINFEKSSCFMFVFWVWVEEFRFPSKLLAGFSKKHSTCAEDWFMGKLNFFQNGFFAVEFGFWTTKIDNWKTIRHVRKNWPVPVQRNFLSYIFE